MPNKNHSYIICEVCTRIAETSEEMNVTTEFVLGKDAELAFYALTNVHNNFILHVVIKKKCR